MRGSDAATPRAVAFYCPFCGETDIRPADPRGYHCQVCDRTWEVALMRVGPGAGGEPGAEATSGEAR
jgi:hypothetical protein